MRERCNCYVSLLPKVVGNSLKSLEVSEDKANQRVEEFKRQLKSLTIKLKEAETRAENAEKNVKKLQKEVDRLEGTLRESGSGDLLPRELRRPLFAVVVQVVWQVFGTCITDNHYTDNNTSCCSTHFPNNMPPSLIL